MPALAVNLVRVTGMAGALTLTVWRMESCRDSRLANKALASRCHRSDGARHS